MVDYRRKHPPSVLPLPRPHKLIAVVEIPELTIASNILPRGPLADPIGGRASLRAALDIVVGFRSLDNFNAHGFSTLSANSRLPPGSRSTIPASWTT